MSGAESLNFQPFGLRGHMAPLIREVFELGLDLRIAVGIGFPRAPLGLGSVVVGLGQIRSPSAEAGYPLGVGCFLVRRSDSPGGQATQNTLIVSDAQVAPVLLVL